MFIYLYLAIYNIYVYVFVLKIIWIHIEILHSVMCPVKTSTITEANYLYSKTYKDENIF